MMLKPLCLAAASLTLSAGLSLAQTSPASPGATAPAPDTRSSGRDKNARKLQAAQSAKVTLAQAIDAAESQGNGKAIESEFEIDNDTAGHYEVKVLTQDGKIIKYKLDGNSGQVTGTENERFESYFTRLKPADLQNAKTSLKQALAIAEQRAGGGKAINADVERENGAVRYEVTVATGDRTQEVKIDASGQVVAND